jgi:S-layer like family, C-terminal region
MQFGKIGKLVAAGTIGAIMAGSTVAFAQLQNYPAPFVEAGSANTLVVVGATAQPSDVVGAIDLVVRLGGQATTDVVVSGTANGLSISGEGKEVATTNTKVFLNDSLGKTGLRSTLTKDDMPTVLANGVLDDADAATTHNYQQFIYLTPSSTSSSNYKLEFERPGSSSSVDPTFSFGRFDTTPTASTYFYRTYVTFDKDVNGSTSVGEKLTLFGNTYTISSGTTTAFTSGTTSDKLVLFGGAKTEVLTGGDTIQATVNGISYDVTLVGDSGDTTAVVKVGSDQQSIAKGASKKVGGLDVYVDDVYRLSTTDQTQNSAKLLLGSAKITLQHGSKVKLGDTEDSIDGTLVNLTVSSGKLSAMTISVGGKSSSDDFLPLGGSYTDPVWKTFSVAFPSMTPGMTDATRDTLSVKSAGDNILQLTITDDRGYTKTVDWAYKASATGSTLYLGDSSGNPFVVVENTTITRDNYFVLDAGDFTHLYKLTGTSIDGTASSNIEITDQFSGVTTKITLTTSNKISKVIDGQTYYFNTSQSDKVAVTWGASAADHDTGGFITVWPRLKAKNGEFIAFVNSSFTPSIPIISGTKIQLPTGAISITSTSGAATSEYVIAAANKEDGTASVLGGASTLNLTDALVPAAVFSLGRTATGPVWYNITRVSATTAKIGLVGAQTGSVVGNASLVLVEERDDNNDQYSVIVSASTESSGSNQVAVPSSPTFTWSAPSGMNAALGSDSTITDYVDLWGTWVRKTTSGQDTLTIHYPDEQAIANIAVLASGATASLSGGDTGSVVKQAVPIKTSLGKLDSEVLASDRANKNFILVGGPAVNTLVKELATSGKTRATEFYVAQGTGYFLIDYVANAFTSGKAALVVAGTTMADSRAATAKLQNFDTASLTGARAEFKNGVLATLSA